MPPCLEATTLAAPAWGLWAAAALLSVPSELRSGLSGPAPGGAAGRAWQSPGEQGAPLAYKFRRLRQPGVSPAFLDQMNNLCVNLTKLAAALQFTIFFVLSD